MKSMTGYGKAAIERDGIEIIIEMKAVNNRHLDLNCKLPRALFFLEDTIRKGVAAKVSRGRVDLFVTYNDKRNLPRAVNIDAGLAEGYRNAAMLAEKIYGVPNDLTASVLLRLPEVVKADAAEDDQEALTSITVEALNNCIDAFNAMRLKEGEALRADISSRLEVMRQLRGQITDFAPTVVAEQREKLVARISEYLKDIPYDEARLLNEVAFYADKVNIDEELTRLGSHFEQLASILKQTEPVGRKLDFLVQELNREANTICSKSNSSALTQVALQLKCEIEKIREQVQNIE